MTELQPERLEAAEFKKLHRTTFINYTFSAVLAYLITLFANEFATFLICSLYNLSPVLYFTKVVTTAEGQIWDRNMVSQVYLVPIFSNFFVGVLASIFLRAMNESVGYAKVIVYWICIISVCRFLNSAVAGSFASVEFGYYLSWTLSNNVILRVIILLVTILLHISISVYLLNLFLPMAPVFDYLEIPNGDMSMRRFFLRISLLYPSLIAGLLVLLFQVHSFLELRFWIHNKYLGYELFLILGFWFQILVQYRNAPSTAGTVVMLLKNHIPRKIQYWQIPLALILLMALYHYSLVPLFSF